MRRSKWLVLGLGLGLFGGGAMLAAPAHADIVSKTFSDAWSAVRTGAHETAKFGNTVFQKTADGSVKAWDATKRATSSAGHNASNTWVQTKVKGKITGDKLVHAGDVHVDVAEGVVTLSGTVRSEQEAARAVEDALSTDGVYAVNSTLQWPTMGPQPVRTQIKDQTPEE